MNTRHLFVALTIAASVLLPSIANAQAVCLPAPRLLTTMPMGGQVGTSVEVTITGDNIENTEELSFSHPGLKATAVVDKNDKTVPNKFEITIAADCPVGIHEARVMTRLGVSSSRVFNVGKLPEAIQAKPNTSLATAMPLNVNSICNSVMTKQAIDYYSFKAQKSQRIVVDCAAQGIDSKLKPVVIIADAQGADLLVERRGGALDFSVPETGTYVIKVHELTYNGGPYYFYRLAIKKAQPGILVPRLPATRNVSSFSWPPSGLPAKAASSETEPNNKQSQAQKITLPCDIAGSFYPAADVDTFEFSAKKGEVWWVEVASERFGLATDPAIVVQHVGTDGKLTDVAEFSDIPSPIKVSTNGYSYNGPPYNAGSTDIIGQLSIKQDGVHRLQLRDLFGGTRNDPRNVYRLVIRKAQLDFALVGWALHMNLRNGDRNALSKPIALRGGSTMAIEVSIIRRDGFGAAIDLLMDGLPDGVTATGVKIPAGQSRGIMLITADQNAPRALVSAKIFGQSMINGKVATRPCHMASMQWPVPDASQQIPSPRLLADVPVSVCGSEFAPITIAPQENKVWEVTAGQKLTLPLVHTRRCEFSGSTITLSTWGTGIGNVPSFEASLKDDSSQAVLDFAQLKTPPGEYVIAFYGSAVAKYRYNLEELNRAEVALKNAKEIVSELAAEAERLSKTAETAPDESKVEATQAANDAAAKKKAAEAVVVAAEQRVKAATARSKPKDIVDIIVSTPIHIRVKPAP